MTVKTIVLLWVVINVLTLYYSFATLGGSNPSITIYSYKLPLYWTIVLSLIVMILFEPKGPLLALRYLIAFAIVVGIALLIYPPVFPAIVYKSETQITRMLYVSVLVVPFQVGVLAPLTAFTGGQESAFNRLFQFSNARIEKEGKSIIIGVILWALILLLGNIPIHGKIFELSIITPFEAFARWSAIHVFFFVLIDHFIFIGLAKFILDSMFKEEETSMLEIILYASLLAGFHYNYQVGEIIRTFLFGLTFAYLYIRTRTLIYGIALATFMFVFT